MVTDYDAENSALHHRN